MLQVFDNWEGQPGAAVVSEGASATRERRLLDWANEMEALVSTQASSREGCHVHRTVFFPDNFVIHRRGIVAGFAFCL
jgi:hypothetical protein